MLTLSTGLAAGFSHHACPPPAFSDAPPPVAVAVHVGTVPRRRLRRRVRPSCDGSSTGMKLLVVALVVMLLSAHVLAATTSRKARRKRRRKKPKVAAGDSPRKGNKVPPSTTTMRRSSGAVRANKGTGSDTGVRGSDEGGNSADSPTPASATSSTTREPPATTPSRQRPDTARAVTRSYSRPIARKADSEDIVVEEQGDGDLLRDLDEEIDVDSIEVDAPGFSSATAAAGFSGDDFPPLLLVTTMDGSFHALNAVTGSHLVSVVL